MSWGWGRVPAWAERAPFSAPPPRVTRRGAVRETHTGRHSQPLFQGFLIGPLGTDRGPWLCHPEATGAPCDVHSNASAHSLFSGHPVTETDLQLDQNLEGEATTP